MGSNITKVMIAGIGGASLGTEIKKSLHLAGAYHIYGCDISPTAYGLYDSGFVKTYLISRDNYVSDVLNACLDSGTTFLIPGGEQPTAMLGESAGLLNKAGVRLVGNSPEVIAAHSDKQTTFHSLAAAGVPIPRTVTVACKSDIDIVGMPCIIKPATGTGGSVAVFFAVTHEEAMLYVEFIRRSGGTPIAQEYVDGAEGEFTIGVLSLPDGQIAGSIALRRSLDAKLSVAYRGQGGLISSGYSQGHIGEYPTLCRQAERIAEVIGSRGPINIQGRVRNGVLLPFEINPRFSASTYLRAMAGFNEVDILIHYLLTNEIKQPFPLKAGWYLRSLTEQYVPMENIK